MASETENLVAMPVADETATWVAAAQDMVKWAATAGVEDLDFTWRSLGALDRLIEQKASAGEAMTLRTKLHCAGYVGEVLVRQFGGRWATGEHYGEVFPPAPPEGEAAEPGSPKAIAEAPETKAAVPTQMVEKRLSEGLALQSQVTELGKAWNVGSGVMSEPAPAADVEQMGSMMRLVAETFVQPAMSNGAVWLDYSPASVMLLDDLIAAWWPATPEKGTYESMIPAMGAYIGEVLIKETGAHWIRDPEGGYGVERDGVVALPMAQVARRFEEGREQAISRFYSELSEKWRPAGEGADATKPKRGLFGRRH